jgi:hypothetical protein
MAPAINDTPGELHFLLSSAVVLQGVTVRALLGGVNARCRLTKRYAPGRAWKQKCPKP